MKVEVQLCTTAIPNSRGEKGLAPVTLCGFAYPLFSILEREFLSLSLSVFLFCLSFPLVGIHTIVARRRRRRRSFSRPPFTLSRTVFHRSSFDSILPAERTHPLSPPPRFHLPSLCSICLSLLLCRCAVPRSRTQSPPAFITRYEIARVSSRFTHTYLPTYHTPFSAACSPDTTPSRYILANFANVGSCRITHLRQYRSFLRAVPFRGIPHIGEERDVHCYYFSRFYRNESLAEILTLFEDSTYRTKVSESSNHRFFGQFGSDFFANVLNCVSDWKSSFREQNFGERSS